MSSMHIPQDTPIALYFIGDVGKNDRERVTKWVKAGILSKNLEDIQETLEAIEKYQSTNSRKKLNGEETSRNNSRGQYLSTVSNTLGKIMKNWEDKDRPIDVTVPQHETLVTALKSREDCQKLHTLYDDEAKRLRNQRKTEKAKGNSAPRENDHDWEILCAEVAKHLKDMCDFFNSPEVPENRRTEVRDAIVTACKTMMPNTRTAWATVKVRNINERNDNYISFSQEEYGDTVVIWNYRKGGGTDFNRKRYNQIIPKQLADILKRYVDVFHQRYYVYQDYLFPFSVETTYSKDTDNKKKGDPKTPEEIMESRKKAFAAAVVNVNKKLIGKTLGESDMRRIQITHMGMPKTKFELGRLAIQFHHIGDEHLGYFRHMHKRGRTEDEADSSAGKKQKQGGEGGQHVPHD
ncbi:hypothetical protein HK097_006853 [Rhizophlyctis rosea]|uniref:Uncharacterized protein n=1 Tax=Rhizophlyctis rosea TaxID=64517 RepID=A0AAD5X1Z3_9FUNG|nr:hypothetical protein HK097_006853 [Rhizophlyctis rosea]